MLRILIQLTSTTGECQLTESTELIFISFPIFIYEETGAQRLGKWPKVAQLVRGRTGFDQVIWLYQTAPKDIYF